MSTLASVQLTGLYSALPAAGIAGRMYYCTDSSGSHQAQVLQDNGSAWVTLGYLAPSAGGGGFVNPMTTTGDMIVGGASGAAARLPIGSSGQVLSVTTAAGSVDGIGWVAGGGGSGVSGYATFQATGSGISNITTGGICTGVTHAGTGLYEIALSAAQNLANHPPLFSLQSSSTPFFAYIAQGLPAASVTAVDIATFDSGGSLIDVNASFYFCIL